MNMWKQLILAQVKMLLRNKGNLVGTFGLAFLSMVIFGSMFGGSGNYSLKLAVVDEDRTAMSRQIIEGLEDIDRVAITMGEEDEQVARVKSGEVNAALVFRSGFGDGAVKGKAVLEGYVDESNTIMAGMVNSALNALVNETNFALLGQQKPISLDLRGVQADRLRNIDYLTPGLIGMMVMWANLYVGARLVFWRERQILRRLGVTPLRPSVLIGSQIVAQAIFSLLQAAALVAIARFWFGVPVKGSYWLLGLTLVLGILAMLAFGYIIGSFVRKSDNASTVTMIIAFPMMFLGGSYFPTDSAPGFMKALANAMPLTYLNDALREIVNNGSGLAALETNYLVMAGWIIVSLLISTRLFRWD